MNEVGVKFTGDPAGLFDVADEVEARLRSIASPTNLASNPFDAMSKSAKTGAAQIVTFTNSISKASTASTAALNQTAAATENLTRRTNALTAAEKARERATAAGQRFDAGRKPTITDYRTDYAGATQTAAAAAPTKAESDAEFNRLRRVRMQMAAEDFAAQDKLERARAYQNSVEKLKIYRAEKAAEIAEETKTAGRIKQIRGFGMVIRHATGGWVDEMQINAGIALLNKYREAASAASGAGSKAATAAVTAGTSVAGGAAGAAAGSGAAAGVSAKIVSLIGTAAEGTTVATTSLIGAAGLPLIYAAYRLSTDRRVEAERALKLEEGMAVVYGRQQSMRKQILDTYAQQTAEIERQAKFADRLKFAESLPAKESAALLNSLIQIKNLQIQAAADHGDAAEANRLLQERNAANQQLLDLPQRETSRLDTDFAARNEMFKQSQQIEREAAERRAKDIQDGIDKIKELGKTWRTTFTDLFVQSNSQNPFVSLYTNGQKALESFRASSVLLSADLRKQGEDMIRQNNALALFRQRADTRLDVFDLRQQARDLRDYVSPDDQNRQRSDWRNRFLRNSPNYEYLLTNRYQMDPSAQNQTFADYLKDDLQKRYENIYGTPQEKIQQGVEDRLSEINKLRRLSGADQNYLDQKVLSLGQRYNPADLTSGERSIIADAADRQAAQKARMEADSYKVQSDLLTVLTSINKQMTGQSGKGLLAIENSIKIQNASDADIEVREALRPPRPSDTARDYGGGLGLSGGGGGLTNR